MRTFWIVGALFVTACGSSGEVTSTPADGGGTDALVTTGQWIWQSNVPATQQLNAVFATGPADAWAAGDNGALLHYDGVTWSATSAGTTNHLHAIWGSNANDVWAVAGGLGGPNTATLVHWNGKAWSAVDSGTPMNLSGIWGSGPKDVYASGASSVAGTIQHFDGTNWSTLFSSNDTAPKAVWGSSAADVWAVGDFIYPAFGDHYILHENAGGFAATTSGVKQYLASVWGGAPNDAWAAGPGVLLHWDGKTWSPMSTTLPKGEAHVWGLSTKEVWAVAGDQSVVAWNGSAWTIAHADPVGAGLNAVGGSDRSHLWAVGDNGTILRFDTSVTGVPTCADVRGQCGAASACGVGQGHSSDYACGGSDVCCVAQPACGGTEPLCCDAGGNAGPRPFCHNGAFVCPSPSQPCPMHP